MGEERKRGENAERRGESGRVREGRDEGGERGERRGETGVSGEGGPSYTFIYLHIPSYTSIYFQRALYIFIYPLIHQNIVY